MTWGTLIQEKDLPQCNAVSHFTFVYARHFGVVIVCQIDLRLEANHSKNCGLPLFFLTDSHP